MTRFRQLIVLAFVSLSLPLLSQPAQTGKPGFEPLPEVLLSFDVVMSESRVELSWSSNAEYNNHYYTIEKSRDAIAFSEFLKIRNFGNNSNIISYFDVDFAPYKGISYYRLTQTNAEGHTLSSRVVSVNNPGNSNVLTLADAGMAESETADTREALVVLRNEKGEESISRVIVNGNDDLRISSDNGVKLDNGTYVIIASSDNKLYSKVVKIQ